jgi:hypothetical protein
MKTSFVCVGLVVLATGCGRTKSTPSAIGLGSEVRLGVPQLPDKGVFLCDSPWSLADLEQRIVSNDMTGVGNLVEKNRVVSAPSCSALVTGRSGPAVRVRITDGEYAGKEFWVHHDWIKLR